MNLSLQTEELPIAQTFEGIELQLPVLMHGIQSIFQEHRFQLIHPNDLEYLVRNDDLIIRVVAEADSKNSYKITVSQLGGERVKFDSIVAIIDQRINSSQ
jgi:hypothetical protein